IHSVTTPCLDLILIPPAQLTGGNQSITTIAFSNETSFLPVRNKNNFNESTRSINGIVLLIKMNVTLNNISMTFDTINNSLANPLCVFWNFTLFDSGGWDTSGCTATLVGNGTVTCECNHLTSFSILMSPYVPFTGVQKDVLDYLTYIGVGVSMGSLVLCLIIEALVWKTVTRSVTSYVHHVSVVNIAVCLLAADVWFIIGAAIQSSGNVGACSTATFFTHLFFLALFFWMLLSAAFLCRAVVAITQVAKSTMMAIAFTVGYIPPVLIAVITIASTAPKQGYLSPGACWLDWGDYKPLLAFVIPALMIVVVNFVILLTVMVKMLRRPGGNAVQASEKQTFVVIARCVAILTPIFGLTWGFGIGTAVDPNNYGLHLVFTILNAFQVQMSIQVEWVRLVFNSRSIVFLLVSASRAGPPTEPG
uniref:Uncharacterized protein n=1 Tax=Denticeps clupeoides TaxID=299321 RepID=A0AAY4ATV2_9TELE